MHQVHLPKIRLRWILRYAISTPDYLSACASKLPEGWGVQMLDGFTGVGVVGDALAGEESDAFEVCFGECVGRLGADC